MRGSEQNSVDQTRTPCPHRPGTRRLARHKHRRERPPSFPAESSRLPKNEGMATVAMRAVAPAAARASAANDRAGWMTRQNAGACFAESFPLESRARASRKARGARASAANARARPVRAARDATTPTITLLAAPNLSRGPRRADYGELCAPSALGGATTSFLFFQSGARRRRRFGARAPPRRLPVAIDALSIERSGSKRAATGRETLREHALTARLVPTPPYLLPPRSSPKTSRSTCFFAFFCVFFNQPSRSPIAIASNETVAGKRVAMKAPLGGRAKALSLSRRSLTSTAAITQPAEEFFGDVSRSARGAA